MSRPIVVDIDGTMSRADRSISGAVIDALHDWNDVVVLATGKAFPYPIAACDFIGIGINVIAENGGVVCADDVVEINGDSDRPRKVVEDLRAAGYDTGWDDADLVNRWRETEIATTREVPRELLTDLASKYGLEVVDSGFAYHVKPVNISKGTGLQTVSDLLDIPLAEFVAIGDSENDVPTFEVAGESYAVANADAAAKAAADVLTEKAYGDGLLEALEAIENSSES